jgi:hypothetical protein
MIDTELDVLDDVAVTADAGKIYLASHDTSEGTGDYDTSIWLKESNWKRVLSRMDHSTDANAAFMVRLAPDDDEAVYVASKSSRDLWRSTDSGMTNWRHVPVDELSTIQDFVVESADVLYAIDTNGATKSTTGGASWGDEKGLDGVTGFMVALAPNGDVLVGGSNGYVAFSKDGGATFTRIIDQLESGDKVYVTADDDYAESNIIFAGAGDEVGMVEADKNEDWDSFEHSDLSNVVSGIAFYQGVLWVLTDNTTDGHSRLWRSLNPWDPDTDKLGLWSFTLEEDHNLNGNGEPQGMKASLMYKNGPRFWAIDTAADPEDQLSRVTDPIAFEGPELRSPANGVTIPVNVESGAAYDVTFSWNRYSDDKILNMDIEIATDADFKAIIVDETITDIDSDTISLVIGPTASTEASFNPGQTYYWRVRHSNAQPAGQDQDEWHWMSPWSEVRSFTVESLVAVFGITSPERGAAGVSITPTFVWTEYPGAINYELLVSDTTNFELPILSRTSENTFYQVSEADALAYSTTYYWRVRGVTGEPARLGREPAPGGPWAEGIFTTMAKPVEPTPPVVIEPTPPAQPPEVVTVEVPVPGPAQAIPNWMLLTIIGIGAVLIIALIVLIVRTRRVA